MSASRLPRIAASLIAQGRAETTPVLLVHNVSLPDEKIYDTTLKQLRDGNSEFSTPLIALVGDVAALRHRSADSIRRTLYTGLSNSNPEFIHTPLIAIHERRDKREILESIHRLNEYDYLLFTSRYAVKYWFATLKESGHVLTKTKIISIGNTTTNALKEEGVTIIIQVEKDDSYGVLDYFCTQPRGKRILFPRSNLGLEILPEGLKKLGFRVDLVTAYDNQPSVNPLRVNLDNIQRVVFTSPSTIDYFIQLYGTLPSHIEYVTQGRITANHLNSRQNETIQRIQERPGDT
jgi:uroporphyrinogen III methyltransferase/synthase